uniref:Uncharacterized protein n=1 Tax=Vitrella brassicaformis TaxID=1169539 RepID=A0A7S1P0X0_9ALVE
MCVCVGACGCVDGWAPFLYTFLCSVQSHRMEACVADCLVCVGGHTDGSMPHGWTIGPFWSQFRLFPFSLPLCLPPCLPLSLLCLSVANYSEILTFTIFKY